MQTSSLGNSPTRFFGSESDNIPVDPEKVPGFFRELSVSDPAPEPGLSSTHQDDSGKDIHSRKAAEISVENTAIANDPEVKNELHSLSPPMAEAADPTNDDNASSMVGNQVSSESLLQSLSEGVIEVNDQKSDVERGSDEPRSLSPSMAEAEDPTNDDDASSMVGDPVSSESLLQSLSEGVIEVNDQKSDVESGSDEPRSLSPPMAEAEDPTNDDDASSMVGDPVSSESLLQSLSEGVIEVNDQKSDVKSCSDETRSLLNPAIPEAKDPESDSDDRGAVQDQAPEKPGAQSTVMDLPVSSVDNSELNARDEKQQKYPERCSKELPVSGAVRSRIDKWEDIAKANRSSSE